MIVLVPLDPCVRFKLFGDTDRAKFGIAFTVRLIVVVLVRVPEVPVMVIGTVPVLAVLLAVSVKVLEVVAGFGPKDAVTPVGRPDTDKLTLPLKPYWGVILIVLVLLAPCTIVNAVGAAERV